MKRDFCKFIVAVTIVLVGVAAIDICTGKAMGNMLPKIDRLCESGRLYYSLNEVEAPILVIGSSRAHHHYVPQIITDSLGLEVYNLGSNGCFYSYNLCVINSILDRYNPKMIIWETFSTSLYDNDKDPLEILYPYYLSNDNIHKCIDVHTDHVERIPLYSNLYRYNSKIHRILIRYATNNQGEDYPLNGYLPLKPREWQSDRRDMSSEYVEDRISPDKEQQFITVLGRLKKQGVKVVVVDSPYYCYESKNNESLSRMSEICDLLNVTFIDNSHLEGFYGNKDLFNENTHLNEIGAEQYTIKFIEQIKELEHIDSK